MRISDTANCGNPGVHEPHLVPSDGRQCQGRSQQNADVAMMIAQIEDALKPLRSLLGWSADGYEHSEPPGGTRVEAHPSVYYAILREAVLESSGTEPKLPVPLVFDVSMPRGAWRLVLAEGKVRDA